MISDTLADAVAEIDSYLRADGTYHGEGAVPGESLIRATRDLMDGLRHLLDQSGLVASEIGPAESASFVMLLRHVAARMHAVYFDPTTRERTTWEPSR